MRQGDLWSPVYKLLTCCNQHKLLADNTPVYSRADPQKNWDKIRYFTALVTKILLLENTWLGNTRNSRYVSQRSLYANELVPWETMTFSIKLNIAYSIHLIFRKTFKLKERYRITIITDYWYTTRNFNLYNEIIST